MEKEAIGLTIIHQCETRPYEIFIRLYISLYLLLRTHMYPGTIPHPDVSLHPHLSPSHLLGLTHSLPP